MNLHNICMIQFEQQILKGTRCSYDRAVYSAFNSSVFSLTPRPLPPLLLPTATTEKKLPHQSTALKVLVLLATMPSVAAIALGCAYILAPFLDSLDAASPRSAALEAASPCSAALDAAVAAALIPSRPCTCSASSCLPTRDLRAARDPMGREMPCCSVLRHGVRLARASLALAVAAPCHGAPG